jgi:hypothetical protein
MEAQDDHGTTKCGRCEAGDSARSLFRSRTHLAGEAQLFHLDAQPVEKVNDLLSRQCFYGTNVTFVKWIAKKGAVIRTP